MKPLLLAAALLTVTAGSAVATPAATPILPGFWKYNLRAAGVIPLDEGRRCIAASEVNEFLAFPGNKHYKCSYSNQTVGNGRVEMVGACVDKKGRRAPIRATGVYSPQNFRLNIALTTTNGVPLRGTMTAQRIAASCPAGAPGTPGNP
jgi:opacity protein-like surface antigen